MSSTDGYLLEEINLVNNVLKDSQNVDMSEFVLSTTRRALFGRNCSNLLRKEW